MTSPTEPRAWMARALALAARGRGGVSPNPMVGCVIVRDGVVVGEGYHRVAGGPHAEIEALRAAGDRARGADVYVTLEPCCHHGRTGPCTEALIGAGVARVIAAQRDPNPRVAGGGMTRLADAGVIVAEGLCQAEAERLNEVFRHWMATGRPFVTLKLATTLDGAIATASGESQWITGPAARQRVHELRAAADAVLVGRGTAEADDPRLTVRGVDGGYNPPWRVVVDSQLRIAPTAKLLDPSAPPGAIIATTAPQMAPAAAALRDAGATVWSLPPDDAGHVDLTALMTRLAQHPAKPITSALVEGGGTLAAALVKAGLVDKLVWFIAPKVIGADGLSGVGPLGLDRLAAAPAFAFAAPERVGDDMMLVAYPRRS